MELIPQLALRDEPYQDSPAALRELRSFLASCYSVTRQPDNWLTGRLEDWRYGSNVQRDLAQPGFWGRNAHLWRDGAGALLGCCIAEYGDGTMFLMPHPDARWIEPEMLRWAETVWAAGRPQLEVNAFVHDQLRSELLGVQGYTVVEECGRLYRYDLGVLRPVAPLPHGFRATSLAADPNIASHVAAVASAFGRPSLDRAWYDAKAAGLGYSPEWDLAVVGPDGQHVAFCTVRRDLANRIAELDPIGTRPEYQQRGLAKALVSRCLAQLAQEGFQSAFIGAGPEPAAGNRLYLALQPTAVWVEQSWRKELG